MLDYRTVKTENDSSDFVPAFVGKYGYPLWKEVYRFPEGENVVYAVPVKSVVPDSEINSIWFSQWAKTLQHTGYIHVKWQRV